VKVVPVAHKLSKVEKRRKEKKLFVPERILPEQRPYITPKNFLDSSFYDGFSTSETKHGRKTAPR
jgi:hypothetical protein